MVGREDRKGYGRHKPLGIEVFGLFEQIKAFYQLAFRLDYAPQRLAPARLSKHEPVFDECRRGVSWKARYRPMPSGAPLGLHMHGDRPPHI